MTHPHYVHEDPDAIAAANHDMVDDMLDAMDAVEATIEAHDQALRVGHVTYHHGAHSTPEV